MVTQKHDTAFIAALLIIPCRERNMDWKIHSISKSNNVNSNSCVLLLLHLVTTPVSLLNFLQQILSHGCCHFLSSCVVFLRLD